MKKINVSRTALAGLAGTAAMTMLMLAAPRMGLPAMNIGHMLGSVMGGLDALGWMAHVMIGVGLAMGYAVAAQRLPGHGALRGTLYGVAPWLMAQLVVMPLMGAGLFGGSALGAMGSLMAHLVYGAIVGAIVDAEPVAAPHPHAA
ncbi:MAG: hypothetical protein EPO40_00500 [Myxococcaceae bacterium]|nr:MAG: hypothetical protein EPO40_00500 [Myxococcaceae bacterium]